LCIPLTLSAFTHFWNPTGFPALYFDEGIYMRRAMHVLNDQGPQEESTFYDHPYFGQLFLAGVFRIIGYPHLLITSGGGDIERVIEMLYFVPRVLMGTLAVVDTFLIYKISEYYYSRKVALISSILFAVMPSTSMLRWILLDSIELTLLLSSILFAIYTGNPKSNNKNRNKINISTILLSGIFLGLAIFTKIPAFTMIPAVGFIVYRRNHDVRPNTLLALWFIPVILIPLIWPAYSISVGTFNFLIDGILWQTHRESQPLFNSIYFFFKSDPILLIIGIAGLFFATIKKNFLPLLWAFPLIIFLYFIGFVSLYHLIPLLPAFCIAAAILIEWLSNKISKTKIQKILFPFIITSGISIIGLMNTTMLITTNANFAYFKAAAFIVQYLENINQRSLYNSYNRVTIIGDAFYLWIPQYIFQLDHVYKIYYDKTPYKTERVLLIVDPGLINAMSRNDIGAKQIQKVYNAPNKIILAAFQQNENKYNKILIYEYRSNDIK
jgi:4-amino-4-deoxy-L-arabinose transferase-like glycosyltransferase